MVIVCDTLDRIRWREAVTLMTIADFQKTYSLMGDQELLNLALEINR